MKINALIFFTALAASLAAHAVDPIVMTVGDMPVARSEFEYLYNKNAGTLAEKPSVARYADLFALFKMKVAEARKAGLDTLSSFRRELESYRRELLSPFMSDSTDIEKLAREAYGMMGEERDVWCVSVPDSRGLPGSATARIDSIEREIKAGRLTFESAAWLTSSAGVGQMERPGHLGWVSSRVFPHQVALRIWALKPGRDMAVVRHAGATHLFRVAAKRRARGETELSMFIASEAAVDSIARQLNAEPALFEKQMLAARPGSAIKGRFGAGEMSPKLDSIAFALRDGEIAGPVMLDGALFFVRKDGIRRVGSYAAEAPELRRRMATATDAEGNPLSDKMRRERLRKRYSEPSATDSRLEALEESRALDENPEVAALLREYEEGSLLYEISRINVWQKASEDAAGMEEFFRRNRRDYGWQEPHVKGLLVKADTPELLRAISARLEKSEAEHAANIILEEFPGKASWEWVVVQRGDNPIVDALVFGGSHVAADRSMLVSPVIVSAPETSADVRARVLGDYQQELEQAWEERLRAAYAVKVNERELGKIK